MPLLYQSGLSILQAFLLWFNGDDLGFFWQAREDLLEQCCVLCLSGLQAGDSTVLLCKALAHFGLQSYSFAV